MEGFYDLCVSKDVQDNELLSMLNLGYKSFAINTILDEKMLNVKKKGKSESSEKCYVPPPVVPQILDNNKKILNRLTLKIGDITLLSKLNQSENLKKYDIIAVIPTSQIALSHACTTMDVDIICFNPEYMNNNKINRKLYKQAVERGIYFEISYAQALKDSSYQKSIIQRAHLYHAIGKSQHMLITSGADNYYQIRAPYDVINLGKIFGMNEILSFQSITENPRKVLLKSDNRQRGKAAVFMEQKSVVRNE